MNEELEQPDFAPEPVSEWKVRLESIRKGALKFLKNGLMIGAVAGLALVGAALAVGVTACTAAGGWPCALAGLVGYQAGMTGVALATAAKFGLLAIGGGAVLGGAVGSALGAAHGFADAEKDIDKAYTDAKMDANQRKMEYHRAQQEKLALEQQALAFSKQTHDMGLMPSPTTPMQGRDSLESGQTAPVLNA